MVRDWLLGLDPGYQRLRRTLRALLSIVFSVAALYGIGRLMPLPLAAIMLSGVAAMLASMSAGDELKERVLTTALLPLPILFAAAVAALTNPLPAWIGYGVLIVIVYGAVEARRFGARGTVLGMSCVMGFFLARFIGVTTSQLSGVTIGLFLAAALATLVREMIVPTAPRSTLHWAIHAFRAQRRHAARLLTRYLDGRVRLRRPMKSAFEQLNTCALAVNTALDSPDTGIRDDRRAWLRAALADSELVVDRCAIAVAWGSNAEIDAVRAALAALLRGESGRARRIAHALPRPRAPRAHSSRAVRAPAKSVVPVQTKQAIQATVASAAAIAVGQWLSPTRWYWAMLAAFVVFAGTSSSGETLRKIWARVLGTAFGVGAGIALASILGTDVVADGVLLVALVVTGLYLQPVSYLSMTFCVTVGLGLVYTITGQPADTLLTLRLEETAIGALFGGLVATLVLPVHTRDAMAAAIEKYLDVLDQAVAASVARIVGDPTGASPSEQSRTLDGQLHGLIARSQPLLNALPFMAPPQGQRDAIIALASCSYYARHLARIAETIRMSASDNNANAKQIEVYRSIEACIQNAIGVITGKAAQSNHRLENGVRPAVGDAPAHDLTQIADILMALAVRPRPAPF